MRKIFKKLAFFFVAILSLTVSSSYSVKEVNAADPTTVTMTSFSATSASMDDVVSYSTAKGGGTSNPAVNSNQIRLYQNSAGTGGGNITIKVKDEVKEDYSLSSVTIGSSMATSIAYTIETETTKSAKTSLAANGKYTQNDINASSITFYCMGTSSSSRLYVNYLSVTYYSESGVISNSVYIAEESIDLYVGDTYTINPDVKPEGSTYKWSNTNPLVASLDENTGEVKAESIGSTTITVTHDGDSTVKDSIIINVLEKPFYSYEFKSKVFESNNSSQLLENEFENNNVEWKLTGNVDDDDYYFSRDNNGRGQQFGKSAAPYTWLKLESLQTFINVNKIIINTSGGSKTTAKLDVMVGNSKIGSQVSLTSSATSYIFDSSNLNGSVSFNFSESNQAIYILSITIYCDNITSTTNISFSESNINLIVGTNTTLNPIIENCEDKTIIWSSSNNEVVSVSNDGIITAISIGNSLITATLAADNTKYASINVNVYRNTNVDLDNENPTYYISEYMPGVDGATNEVHKLDNNTTITTNNCNFNSKLSIYQDGGYVVIKSIKVIDKIIVNCYSNSTNVNGTLNAKGSLDMESWTNIKSLLLHINENSSNEEFDLTNYYYKYVKLDISNTPEVIINSITLELSDRVPVSENPISNYETNASLSFNYKYNVNEEVNEPSWNLVKDVAELKIGDKVVVVASKFDYALSTTQNDNNRGQATISKSGDTITFGDDVQMLTIENGTKDNTFAFNTGAGYLYAASSSKNYLRTEKDLSDNGSWSIEIVESGVATIKAQGSNTRNWMRYNSTNSAGAIFSCYSSGQDDICLYKYYDGKTTTTYTNEQFSNVKIGFSASVNAEDFGGKSISKAGVIFTSTDNAEEEISKTISNAIMPNIKDTSLNEYLDSNNDYRYLEKSYTEDKPLEAKDGKYVVGGAISVISGEVTEDNISRLSKTVTAAIYFVVDGEVIILQDKTYSVKGMLNEYSTNAALTEQQQEAVNVFKAYIEG